MYIWENDDMMRDQRLSKDQETLGSPRVEVLS